MKFRILASIVVLVSLIFAAGSERVIQAQGEVPNSPLGAEIQADITPLIGYQGRLSINGAPAQGSITMTFKLFPTSSGGTAEWEETKVVTVSNGLFQTALGDTAPLDASFYTLSNNLWLEITVSGTTLPRQRLTGAPYALSLAPGAVIKQTANTPSLNIQNSGTGAALHAVSQSGYSLWGSSDSGDGVYGESQTGNGILAESNGTGLSGAALKAQAKNVSGIAMWADAESSDAAVVTINKGSGALLKGFGADGGEHEFIIENDGSFMQELEADGLVKAAVFAYCANDGSSIERSFNNVIWTFPMTIINGATAGSCWIDLGFPVSQRYFMVTAPAVPGYDQMAFASCLISPTYPNSLFCVRADHAGSTFNGYIMILVY